MAAPPQIQVNTQGVALRDRGGTVLALDSDEIGIQNIGGVLKQVAPNGTTSPLGGGAGVDPGTLFTVPGTVQDIDFATGLNGDTDGDYEAEWDITMALSGQTLALQPNGSAPSSCERTVTIVNASSSPSVTSVAAQTDMGIGDVSTDLKHRGRLRLTSKSGRVRLMQAITHRGTIAGNTTTTYYTDVLWGDTVTVISSLRLHGSAASSIVSGTVRWRKLGFTA